MKMISITVRCYKSRCRLHGCTDRLVRRSLGPVHRFGPVPDQGQTGLDPWMSDWLITALEGKLGKFLGQYNFVNGGILDVTIRLIKLSW